MENKTKRILELLEDLKSGKEVCVKSWAKKKGVSERSVQRYIKEISQFYEIELYKTKKGCYELPQFDEIKKRSIDKSELRDFEKFAHIVAAMSPEFLKFLGVEEKILRRIVDEKVYYLKESPIEELKSSGFLKVLKSAIKYRKVLEIEYESDKTYNFEFKPYKIVFSEGNWYLTGMSNDEINNGFKFLRLNFIKNIKETSKSFKKDKEVEDFIYNFQSLFSRFRVLPFEVIVRVDKEVSRYFKAKKFLSSQNIIDEDEKGLLIRYYVTSDEEILFLAKRWLPYMKILYPSYLQEKLQELAKKILTDTF
ncbi:MAG: WYL domain-containing protein [Nautiliaceae bacterium]